MTSFRNVSAGIAVLISLTTIGLPSLASAREKLTYAQGMRQCVAWCESHNSSPGKLGACKSRCDVYWVHNGSDGQLYQIEGN